MREDGGVMTQAGWMANGGNDKMSSVCSCTWPSVVLLFIRQQNFQVEVCFLPIFCIFFLHSASDGGHQSRKGSFRTRNKCLQDMLAISILCGQGIIFTFNLLDESCAMHHHHHMLSPVQQMETDDYLKNCHQPEFAVCFLFPSK